LDRVADLTGLVGIDHGLLAGYSTPPAEAKEGYEYNGRQRADNSDNDRIVQPRSHRSFLSLNACDFDDVFISYGVSDRGS
jgi:hypothetical protein